MTASSRRSNRPMIPSMASPPTFRPRTSKRRAKSRAGCAPATCTSTIPPGTPACLSAATSNPATGANMPNMVSTISSRSKAFSATRRLEAVAQMRKGARSDRAPFLLSVLDAYCAFIAVTKAPRSLRRDHALLQNDIAVEAALAGGDQRETFAGALVKLEALQLAQFESRSLVLVDHGAELVEDGLFARRLADHLHAHAGVGRKTVERHHRQDKIQRLRRVERVEANDLRPRRFSGIIGIDDDDLVAMPHRAQDIEQVRRQQRIDILEHVILPVLFAGLAASEASARRRRIGAHQARRFQFAPQRGWNLRADHLRVAHHLARLLPARYDGDDRGMAEREADRRLGELHIMFLADRLDFRDALQDLLGCGRIIIEGARLGACRQNAGIERAADHHADLLLHAIGQETFERFLFEQRIAPGQQEHVEIAGARQMFGDLPFVDARADRLDGAAVAQFDQRLVAAFHQLLDMRIRRRSGAMSEDVDVMDVDDVDMIEPEALQRKFQRAHDAVIGIVETFPARRRFKKGALARTVLRRA